MHNCNKEDLLISLVQQYLKQILQGVPWAVFKDVFARSQASPKHGGYVLATGNGHLASGGGRSPLRAYVGSIPRTGLGSSKGLRLLSVSPKGVRSWSCNKVVAALFLHKAELSMLMEIHPLCMKSGNQKMFLSLTTQKKT